MSNQKFDHMAKFGDFLEWEWVHGNKYGTLASQLEDVIDNNEIMLLDIDVKGGFSIMEEYPENSFSIFIEPPGFDIPEKKLVLEERLLKRGNEQTTQIKNRLKRFEKEMEFIDRFNSSFVNDDLKEAIIAVENAIKENI
jgi:guanylate kinase